MAPLFEQIFETYNSSDIAFLTSLLDEHGVDYVVDNEHFATLEPFAGVPMILKVPVLQAALARDILKDFQGGSFGQGRF